jgi:signal transduction histidine kinase
MHVVATPAPAPYGLDPDRILTLYRVGKLVSASVDLAATLSAIVNAAQQLTGAASIAILLVEDDAQLVVRAGCGPALAAMGQHVPISAGVVGRALDEGQPILIDDMQHEPSRARPDLDAITSIRSYLAMPLVWRGETLGVVTVGALEPGALDATDARLVSELAEQASAAVANARAYDTLKRTQNRLIESEKLSGIGQLAHGIAHELNTPLGVIISNLSVLGQYADGLSQIANTTQETLKRLRRGDDPGQIATDLEAGLRAAELDYLLEDLPALASESADGAKRMASIVRSVALFARGGSDNLTPVSAEEALEAAITLAWSELKQRSELVRDYTPVPLVVGNTAELTQLFVHLLLNAAHALDCRSGTIRVSLHHEGEVVAARISDTGRGIPAEHLARVFEPFFTTRPVGEGSGVGLAVCHGIATRMGGTIGIESEVGAGTTVTVRLPRAKANAETDE